MLKKRSTFTTYIVLVFLSVLMFVLMRVYKPRLHVQPKPVTSMINLKQIGLASRFYAEDHDDIFPENLVQLEEYIPSPDIFESPLKPRDFDGPSYIYVSGHSLKDSKSQEKYILFYENPEYCEDTINALFIDGHVEKLEKERFLFLLEETYINLGREMPKIKFKE